MQLTRVEGEVEGKIKKEHKAHRCKRCKCRVDYDDDLGLGCLREKDTEDAMINRRPCHFFILEEDPEKWLT